MLDAAVAPDPAPRVLVGGPLHNALEPVVITHNELHQLFRRRAVDD